jgi:hypothetical protein
MGLFRTRHGPFGRVNRTAQNMHDSKQRAANRLMAQLSETPSAKYPDVNLKDEADEAVAGDIVHGAR